MGRIAAPYGVKGWLKVLPLSAAPETLLSHREWWLRSARRRRPVAAACSSRARPHGSTLIVAVVGIGGPRSGGAACGRGRRRAARALPAAGEKIYWADLVGLAVVNRQGEMLGSVAAVQDFGAHPVLRVRDDEGRSGSSRSSPRTSTALRWPRRIEVDWQKDY